MQTFKHTAQGSLKANIGEIVHWRTSFTLHSRLVSMEIKKRRLGDILSLEQNMFFTISPLINLHFRLYKTDGTSAHLQV